MPIRYIRDNNGNIHVNIIGNQNHPHTIVILPHFFSRITGVSISAKLGYIEINVLQAVNLGFIVSDEERSVAV
jgi:hypothetical protein